MYIFTIISIQLSLILINKFKKHDKYIKYKLSTFLEIIDWIEENPNILMQKVCDEKNDIKN